MAIKTLWSKIYAVIIGDQYGSLAEHPTCMWMLYIC